MYSRKICRVIDFVCISLIILYMTSLNAICRCHIDCYRLTTTHHDAASKFIRIITRGLQNSILPEDLIPLVQDVVETHPGLTFLKEATEFHSRYVHTVCMT